MANTLKDFLVSIGWEFDEQKHSKFVGAIRTAEVQAKLLADALEAMARKVWDSVAQTANAFDQLYFSSQRTGASAATIRDMGYAVGQLGGNAQAAQASLEAMAAKLRENKGNIYYVEQLGLHFNKLTGQLEDSAEGVERFQKLFKNNPNVAEQMRQGAGMDMGTYLARANPEYQRYMREAEAMRKLFGFDPVQAGKDAHEFMTTWRGVANEIELVANKLFISVMHALEGPFKEFKKFLEANGPDIGRNISNIAKALNEMADRWVRSFETILKDPDALKGFKDTMRQISEDVSSLVVSFGKFVDFLKWINEKGQPIADILNKIIPSGPKTSGSFWDGPWNNWGFPQTDHIMPEAPAAPAPAAPPAPKRHAPLHRLWNWLTGSGDDQASVEPGSAGGTGAAGYAAVYNAAKNAGDPFPEVTAAQWALESSWGRKPSGRNNFFGQTRDGVPGHWMDYDTPEAGLADHMRRWNPKYGNARTASEAIRNLVARGYTPDPGYIEGVERIMGQMRSVSGGTVGGLNVLPGHGALAGGGSHPGLVDVARILQAADPSVGFTALNDAYHQNGGGSGPNGPHGRGMAFDAVMKNIEWSKAILRSRLAAMGFNEGRWGTTEGDYTIEPGTGGGTGPHLHFQWQNQSAAARFHQMVSPPAKPSAWANAGSWAPGWKGAGVKGALGAFGASTPLGAGAGDATSVAIHAKNEFHIDGANDPSIVAHMVAANQDRVNSDLTRNMIGATF